MNNYLDFKKETKRKKKAETDQNNAQRNLFFPALPSAILTLKLKKIKKIKKKGRRREKRSSSAFGARLRSCVPTLPSVGGVEISAASDDVPQHAPMRERRLASSNSLDSLSLQEADAGMTPPRLIRTDAPFCFCFMSVDTPCI